MAGDYEKYNSSKLIEEFAKISEVVIHVTQIIDMCPKDVVYSNLSKYMDIPYSAPHVYSVLGTAVHKYISDTLNGESAEPEDYFPITYNNRDKFNRAIRNFHSWKDERLVNITKMYSEISRVKKVNDYITITGTSDLIVEQDGDMKVIDFKTAKTANMVDKYFLQLGGYAYMFNDLNIKYGEIVILGGSKYKVYSTDVEQQKEKFVEYVNRAIETIDKIRNKRDVPAKVSFRCAMCSFRGICNGSDIIYLSEEETDDNMYELIDIKQTLDSSNNNSV